MKVFRYILAAVLFAVACPLYAQWSCGVDAAVGIGSLGQRVEDLDQDIEKSFLSADQKELWVESARLNRRILLLGGSWNF